MKWLLVAGMLLITYPIYAMERVTLRVPDDHASISEAIASLPEDGVIIIQPGEYHEALVIEKPITLRGIGEVILTGNSDEPVITVTGTEGVTIAGLTIQGGQYGILITRSQDVTIRNNTIRDNRLAGIKVRLGAADIVHNMITSTGAPYGKGIHITNTMDWPTTRIRQNTIIGNATSGITTNMAMARITDNIVQGNGGRGIAVTEMSEAVVANNEVDDHAENGIYVSDQSVAIICNNVVVGSGETSDSARYGNGITVDYGAQVEIYGNTVHNSAEYGISALDDARININANNLSGNGADEIRLSGQAQQQQNLDLPESCKD